MTASSRKHFATRISDRVSCSFGSPASLVTSWRIGGCVWSIVSPFATSPFISVSSSGGGESPEGPTNVLSSADRTAAAPSGPVLCGIRATSPGASADPNRKPPGCSPVLRADHLVGRYPRAHLSQVKKRYALKGRMAESAHLQERPFHGSAHTVNTPVPKEDG